MLPASGRQIELHAGGHHAVIAAVGASLRLYEVDDADVVARYGPGEMAEFGQGQVLVPWPNRLEDGRYTFGDRTLQVPLSEPERHNAIHGFSRWAAWEVVETARARAVLELRIHPRAGYPFMLTVQVAYELDARTGLTVRTTAANEGAEPLPYGAGYHPYVRVGGPVDDATLHLDAGAYLDADDRGLPTGRAPAVEGSAVDFRTARRIGDTQLDTAFTALARDAEGCASVRLAGADGGPAVTVWLDEHHPYVLLFTGDPVPDPRLRRAALGVEPMTCAPNAFATGDGLRTLEPGERWTTVWGIRRE